MKSIIKILCGTIIVSAIVCFGSFEAFSTIYKGNWSHPAGIRERDGVHLRSIVEGEVAKVWCDTQQVGCCWQIRDGELEVYDEVQSFGIPTFEDVLIDRQ